MEDKAYKSVAPVFLERALRGSRSSLIAAFSWHETRQGFEYWNEIYSGEKGISPEDNDYLKEILSRHYSEATK